MIITLKESSKVLKYEKNEQHVPTSQPEEGCLDEFKFNTKGSVIKQSSIHFLVFLIKVLFNVD